MSVLLLSFPGCMSKSDMYLQTVEDGPYKGLYCNRVCGGADECVIIELFDRRTISGKYLRSTVHTDPTKDEAVELRNLLYDQSEIRRITGF